MSCKAVNTTSGGGDLLCAGSQLSGWNGSQEKCCDLLKNPGSRPPNCDGKTIKSASYRTDSHDCWLMSGSMGGADNNSTWLEVAGAQPPLQLPTNKQDCDTNYALNKWNYSCVNCAPSCVNCINKYDPTLCGDALDSKNKQWDGNARAPWTSGGGGGGSIPSGADYETCCQQIGKTSGAKGATLRMDSGQCAVYLDGNGMKPRNAGDTVITYGLRGENN
tara:strand:+ start:1677 stop:2333 length:657 start_codon:yes stop_codon:yes gene_type:complete